MTCPSCGGELDRYGSGRNCWRCVRAVERVQWEAYLAMRKAIREGRLARPSTLYCVDCGSFADRYDHRDYFRPTHVEPVCASCNIKRGGAIQYAPNSIEHFDLEAA